MAHQTVNLAPSGRVGSSPTYGTKIVVFSSDAVDKLGRSKEDSTLCLDPVKLRKQLRLERDGYSITIFTLVLQSSWSGRLPVTEEITGSSPVRTATHKYGATVAYRSPKPTMEVRILLLVQLSFDGVLERIPER